MEVTNLRFSWQAGHATLSFPDISLERGEHLFLHGPSGSGKSTLLSLLAGMLRPTDGSVRILGTDIHRLGAGARDQFRADHMGVIFQQFNLVPYLTTLGNVTLPCGLSALRSQRSEPTVTEEAERLLTALSIPRDHWQRKVTRLSIGQQQRIAAARALIGAPGLILADEPTGNLDSANGEEVMNLLQHLNKEGTTIVMVTHSPSDAENAHRIVQLFDGQVVTENIKEVL